MKTNNSKHYERTETNGGVIDTLRFTTDQEVNLTSLITASGVTWKRIRPFNYQNGIILTLPNHETLRVWNKSIPGRRLIGSTILETEVSDFSSWADFLSLLSSIIPGFDQSEAIIKRTDLYVDVPIPLVFFKRNLFILRKRKCEEIRSTSDSLIIGKRPIRNSIYERHKRLRKPNILTRVESQLSKKACPIRSLADVQKLLDFDPFANFHFYEYVGGSDIVINQGLEGIILSNPLQDAIKKLGGFGRFKKFVSKGYFRKLTEPNLSKVYRESLQQFLSEGKTGGQS